MMLLENALLAVERGCTYPNAIMVDLLLPLLTWSLVTKSHPVLEFLSTGEIDSDLHALRLEIIDEGYQSLFEPSSDEFVCEPDFDMKLNFIQSLDLVHSCHMCDLLLNIVPDRCKVYHRQIVMSEVTCLVRHELETDLVRHELETDLEPAEVAEGPADRRL
jgi:hypothetical protein